MSDRAKKFGLMLFSLTLFCSTAEYGSRVWLKKYASKEQFLQCALPEDIPPQQWELSPHHYMIYRPTPGYVGERSQMNSLGYRGPEISREKPKGTFRIVLLGGSSTFDTSIASNAFTFAAQLERELRLHYHHKNVEVVNAGVPGFTSWESLINLEFRVLDIEPDMIIYCEAVNDVHARLVIPSSYASDNSGMRRWWSVPPTPWWEHSCFLRVTARLSGSARSRQVQLEDVCWAPTAKYAMDRANTTRETLLGFLSANQPIYYRRNIENMVAIAREHGLKVVLATWAHTPVWHDYTATTAYEQGIKENNEVVESIAQQDQIPLFDYAAVMPTDAKYWDDGRHVTEIGAKKKAELFAAFLEDQRLISDGEKSL